MMAVGLEPGLRGAVGGGNLSLLQQEREARERRSPLRCEEKRAFCAEGGVGRVCFREGGHLWHALV